VTLATTQIVEAHGKRWLLISTLGADSPGNTWGFAVQEGAKLPARVHLIYFERKAKT
jgi:hypothetical protein